MRKHLMGLALLLATNIVFAGNNGIISLLFYNYTVQPGTVFLGTAPEVMGPGIGINGDSAQWAPILNGNQEVGLQTASGSGICYLTGGPLILNAALYKGDTVTVIYGQPQYPTGIACGCYGSACDVGIA